jgi:hypothetical protein
MARVKILYDKFQGSFNAEWLTRLVNQYLEFEPWDPTQQYPKGTLFYKNWLNVRTLEEKEFCQQQVEQGFKIIIDNLWEINPGPVPNTFRLCCDRWFWYYESLWYQHLGYDQYQPQRTPNYLALMPMNKDKPHRTDFVKEIEPMLDRMIWSYVEQGRQLPGDGDMNDWNTQRFFNPDWYNQTYTSMVVETLASRGSRHTPVFITEKTTKPLAFQHPFIVYGNSGTLRTLKSWGFETFSNLWNEDYDEIGNTSLRRDAIVDLLKQLTIKQHDAETLRRLQHNRDHFFDRALVEKGIVQEILEPIINYAETR